MFLPPSLHLEEEFSHSGFLQAKPESFKGEEIEIDDGTLFMRNQNIPTIKRESSLLNKQYQQKEHKKFAIGLKRRISAGCHFWNNGNSTRLLNSFPPNRRGGMHVEPEDLRVQLPPQTDALLFIHPSNYSLRNLKFEDTKDRPYLSPSAIDLIERKCGCRGNPI